MRPTLHLTAETHLVDDSHDGIVGRCRRTSDIDGHDVAVLDLEDMIVGLHTHLQLAMIVVARTDGGLGIDGARALLKGLEDDVGIVGRRLWSLTLILQIINGIGIEHGIARRTESLNGVNGSLGSHVLMLLVLIATAPVPVDSLKACPHLPHLPEELARLTVAHRAVVVVAVEIQPLGKHLLLVELDGNAVRKIEGAVGVASDGAFDTEDVGLG